MLDNIQMISIFVGIWHTNVYNRISSVYKRIVILSALNQFL